MRGRRFIPFIAMCAWMFFSSISASADQCTCDKEVIGQRKLIDDKSFAHPSAIAVDTTRGNYFLLQSETGLQAAILNSSGSKIKTITISTEPVHPDFGYYFSVVYSDDKDRYFVVWVASNPAESGNQRTIHGQFIRAATGELIGPSLDLAKGALAAVKLVRNRVNDQYILGFQTRNQNNRPTLWLQRLTSGGGLFGSRANHGIHSDLLSMQQDTTTNRFLLAWSDRYLNFLVIDKTLNAIGSKKRIVEATDPYVVYSARRKSFVLFSIARVNPRSLLQSHLIDANGQFSGRANRLFHLSQIYGIRANPDTHGFLVLYPLFTGRRPEVLIARIGEDFSIEEKGVAVGCPNLYQVTATLVSNPLDSEYVVFWSGDEEEFDFNAKTYFQRIRSVQTGTCN